MNIQIFGTTKCFDTKKAQRYFKERNINVQNIDLKVKSFSKRELESVLQAVGGLDNVIDKESKKYKNSVIEYLGSDEEKIEKLLDNPEFFKTPIVRNGQKATVGYCPDVWKEWE